jgi:hypothetical protein
MTRSFTTYALSSPEVVLAYPLVNAALPDVDLCRWQAFAEAMSNGYPDSRGVLGMRGGGDYLCGVMVYRADQDLRHGRVLALDLFVALDLVNQVLAVGTLLDIAEAKARELKCDAVHIRVGAKHKSLTKNIEGAGYMPEALLLHKPLAESVVPN